MLKNPRFTSRSCLAYALLLALATSLGCGKSGIDFSALPLGAEVVDYGQNMRAGKVPVELEVYGQLKPGTENHKSSLADQVELIYEDLNALRTLPKAHNLSKAHDIYGLADDVEDEVQEKITPALKDVTTAAGAKTLVELLGDVVKTGGSLEISINETIPKVPAGLKASFEQKSAKLVKDFGNFYASSIALALNQGQQDLLEHLNNIDIYLGRMAEMVAKRPVIINENQRNTCENSLIDARNKRSAILNFADAMPKRNVVSPQLSSNGTQLQTALDRLLIACQNHAEAALMPEFKTYLDEANRSFNEFNQTVTSFSTLEAIKTPSADLKLSALMNKAFDGGLPLVLGEFATFEATDVNRLMEALESTPTVVLRKGPSSHYLVQALTASIVHNVAQEKGDNDKKGDQVDNVLALDLEAMLKAKSDYDMDNAQFLDYAESRADKLMSEHPKSFYEITDSADFPTENIKDRFEKNKHKVILISDDPKYGAPFIPEGLSIGEAAVLATAISKKEKSSISNPLQISQIWAKARTAFGGPIDLYSLSTEFRKILGSLKNNNPRLEDIKSAVMSSSLSPFTKQMEIKNSRVWTHSAATVSGNLAFNPNYYRNDAISKVSDFDPIRLTEIDEQRKTRKLMEEETKRRIKLRELSGLYSGYKNQLNNVKNTVDLLRTAQSYQIRISQIKAQAVGTLDSMRSMLNHQLCSLPSRDMVTRNPADYDGGQYELSQKPNAPTKQAYNHDLLKNPLSLFDVEADRVSVNPAEEVNISRNANITMNCFLTAPGRGNQYDGKYVLGNKIRTIKQTVENVADEARSLATSITMPGAAETNFQALSNRLDIMAGGVFNPNAWERELSVYNPGGGGIPETGRSFNLVAGADNGYLYTFPDVTADSARANVSSRNLLPRAPAYLAGGGYNLLPQFILGAPRRTGLIGATPDADKYAQSNFNNFEAGSTNNVWTISRVFGVALRATLPALGVDLNITVPGVAAPVSPYSKDNFEKLNVRLWAWFLGRIVGKLPSAPDPDQLYKVQGGVNYFDDDHVFIKVLKKESKTLLEVANRHLIAEKALETIEIYKGMMEILYSLAPEDYEAFLAQAPNNLTMFFSSIKNALTERVNIDAIANENQAGMATWMGSIFHAEIQAALPGAAGADKFTGAAPPVGGDNARISEVWTSLVQEASKVEALRDEIAAKIALLP